jgi:hypothetical protein
MELVLTISMKPELLEDDEELLLEPPRLPAVEPEPEPDPDPELDPEPELLEDDEELLLEAPDTVSPCEMLCTLTTVPVAGAYR